MTTLEGMQSAMNFKSMEENINLWRQPVYESPSYYEEVSKKLMADLGIDFQKFYTAYDFDYFKIEDLLPRSFNKETYGENKIVRNVPNYRYDINHKKNTNQKILKKL